jgi:hypothetical protein
MEIHDSSFKIKFLFIVLLNEWWKEYVSEVGSQLM